MELRAGQSAPHGAARATGARTLAGDGALAAEQLVVEQSCVRLQAAWPSRVGFLFRELSVSSCWVGSHTIEAFRPVFFARERGPKV